MQRRHEEAVRRKRPVVFNNDGDDALYFPVDTPVTPGSFLKARFAPLLGTNVSTVFYCTTLPFGLFEHRTEIGEVLMRREPWNSPGIPSGTRSAIAELVDQRTDPLALAVEFCRANGLEVFSSIRMNDVHDVSYPFKPAYKRRHPDFLFGTEGAPPPYGYWTGVDYGRAEVREAQLAFITDLCTRYDVDGIELDFWRHPPHFRSQAWGKPVTEDETRAMTDLVRRVREMTRAVEERRGRPFLIAARVIESAEMSRWCGLDLVTWLEQDLIDILVTGEFALAPWKEMVDLGHRYDTPVYPCIRRAPREDAARQSIESYRAMALQAWGEGADGIYFFNLFPEERIDVFHELGRPELLAREDRLHHVYGMGQSSFVQYIPEVARLATMPTLGPMAPKDLAPGVSYRFPLYIGGLPQISGAGISADFSLQIDAPGLPEGVAVTVNGRHINLARESQGRLTGPVEAASLRHGHNQISVRSGISSRLMDVSISVSNET
ncbi:MAG: hypothetical protein FJ319_07980 [SAR202 cluster bacterium]|nr:hypothetical protein [SAR202 cluster bacterium]